MKLKSINPATLEVISEIETTPVDEVFEISVRAREAFKKWSNTTIDERLKLLKNAREILYKNQDEIAKLITLENGKPILESYSMEIFPTLDLFDFYIKNSKRILKPKKVRSQIPLFWVKSNYIHFEPLGVVLPVNEILSTCELTSASPTSPKPITMLKTPSGKPASLKIS